VELDAVESDTLMGSFPLQSVQRGIVLSVPRHMIPDGGYYTSDGMSMYQGALTLAPGYTKFNAGQNLGAPVMDLEYFRDSQSVGHLVAMTTLQAYKYVTPNFVDITNVSGNYTGTLDDFWLTDICPNVAGPDTLWFVATNGKDPVQKWDGTNATRFVNLLGGMPADSGFHYSKAISMFQGSLFHLNRKEAGKQITRKVVWSDTGRIETYGLGNGIAGDFVLFQGFDEGLRLEPLSNYLVAYRRQSVHLISLIGGAFVFGQQQIVDGVGLLAARACLNLDTRHLFLGSDDVYLFNGVDLETVGNEIRDQMFSEIDQSVADRSLIAYNAVRNQAAIIVPGPGNQGYPNTWWLWNLNTGVWSGPIRNRPVTGSGEYFRSSNITWNSLAGNTWNAMVGSWDSKVNATTLPIVLFGQANGIVYQLDESTVLADSVVVSGRLESRAVYPGGILQPPAEEVVATEFLPLTSGAGAGMVGWYLGVSDNPMGPFVYTGPVFRGPRGLVKFKPTRGKWFVIAGEASNNCAISGGVLGFERGWTNPPS